MKRHKQVGISENDFRGRLNPPLKDRIKNPLFKQIKKRCSGLVCTVFFIQNTVNDLQKESFKERRKKNEIYDCIGYPRRGRLLP